MNKTVAKYWARAVGSRYLYAWVPYLRYVGLNGSLPRGAATDLSDIDLMVVAEPGHIFTVRFFLVGILALMGLKRTQTKVAGRICANYFLTSDDLDIKPHNRRVAEWYRNMIALVDSCHPDRSGGIPFLNNNKGSSRRPSRAPQDDTVSYQELIMHQNWWMGRYTIAIPGSQRRLNRSVRPVGEPWQSIRSCIEFALFLVADALEMVLKYIQLKKIKNHPLTSINPNKIIVNDRELRFHPRKMPMDTDS